MLISFLIYKFDPSISKIKHNSKMIGIAQLRGHY